MGYSGMFLAVYPPPELYVIVEERCSVFYHIGREFYVIKQ